MTGRCMKIEGVFRSLIRPADSLSLGNNPTNAVT